MFSSVANKHCDEFKLADLSADDFKCLIFVQGLVPTKDSEIRRRVLTKLESEPNLTLKKLAEDCQRIINIKKDSRDIEESGVTHVRNLHKKLLITPRKKKNNNKERTLSPLQTGKTSNQTPSTPCFRCRKFHWSSDCPFRTKKYLNCEKVGHKSSHCKSQNNKNRFIKQYQIKNTKIIFVNMCWLKS